MLILDKAVFVGPSLYAHFPVIRLDIDLGALEQWPSGKLGPAFTEPLLAALPGLHTHTCSYGKPGGFVRRLTEGEGTWMGHILEHVAIELQNVAGETVTFGKTRSHGPPGHYYVIYQYEQEDVGVEAGRLGLTLLHSLLPRELRPEGSVPPGFDFAAERDEFIRFAQRRALGPSARCRRGSISRPSGTSSSAMPSGGTWDPAPWRWCGRRRSGRSPGSG